MIPTHRDLLKDAMIGSIGTWIEQVEGIEALTSDPAALSELQHLRIGMVQARIALDRLADRT